MNLTEEERTERRRRYDRDYYSDPANLLKKKARRVVCSALANGSLIQPLSCQNCGCATETEAHHPDYSQPLAVIWLCVPCHRGHHSGPYGGKTHCKHGHEYTPENTYYQPCGKRYCAECKRVKSRDAMRMRRSR